MRPEGGADDRVAVQALVLRPREDVEVAVVAVRRLAPQIPGDDVRAVALRLEEGHRVVHPGREQLRRRADRERWGGGLDGAGHRDPVGPGCGEGRQVQGMHGRPGTVPRAPVGSGGPAQDDGARRIDDGERRTRRRHRGEQVGHLRLPRQVAQLIDPDEALDRGQACCGGGARVGGAGRGGDRGAGGGRGGRARRGHGGNPTAARLGVGDMPGLGALAADSARIVTTKPGDRRDCRDDARTCPEHARHADLR